MVNCKYAITMFKTTDFVVDIWGVDIWGEDWPFVIDRLFDSVEEAEAWVRRIFQQYFDKYYKKTPEEIMKEKEWLESYGLPPEYADDPGYHCVYGYESGEYEYDSHWLVFILHGHCVGGCDLEEVLLHDESELCQMEL